MEEYKSLRQESLTSITTQQSVLRYGLAITGVLIASAIKCWNDIVLCGALTLVFIPIVCYLVLIIWMGEVGRMMRAGQHILMLEKKVNLTFKEQKYPALSWENYLRKHKNGATPQLNWSYLAILGLFLFFAVASIVLGNFLVWASINTQFKTTLNLIEVFVFILTFVILISNGMKFR
ncbi:MAG: hypothetical protein Q3M24_08715 [Candidatus Electrothrix aestuarii]|uniref:Uncharacterized protein n=1 Tax=Candidatus Electrothrix aestuarii TaxID=3062594 RepID=A0AAU8M0B1_9BACT|nr:hypothetical protein [Candidatus Electrothrix aestuarii]